MMINEAKTKALVVNFSQNHQFTPLMELNNVNIKVVDKMKILGTWITDKLTWDDNCKNIIMKVNRRMLLLKKIHSFGATNEEMTHLWTMYCRPILELSAVVWRSSITKNSAMR